MLPQKVFVMQRLREGGFSHILIDRRASSIPFFGWDRMAITNEDFLRRNTTLVAGGQYIYLYRILAPEQFATAPPWALGSERVTNGGFEQAEADHLMGWGRSGNPQHDQSGTSSRNGAGAVRLSPDDGISTTVTIEPGRTYLATGATRSIEGYGLVEMRIEWFDQKGKLIGISREKMLSSPLGYRAYSILATAPKQAHTAIVTIRADDGQAWVDDVSLRSVTRDTSASATTLPPFILLP